MAQSSNVYVIFSTYDPEDPSNSTLYYILTNELKNGSGILVDPRNNENPPIYGHRLEISNVDLQSNTCDLEIIQINGNQEKVVKILHLDLNKDIKYTLPNGSNIAINCGIANLDPKDMNQVNELIQSVTGPKDLTLAPMDEMNK